MNAIYERFYGPDSYLDGCPACQFELAEIGPLHGPERPTEWQLARNRFDQEVRLHRVRSGLTPV